MTFHGLLLFLFVFLLAFHIPLSPVEGKRTIFFGFVFALALIFHLQILPSLSLHLLLPYPSFLPPSPYVPPCCKNCSVSQTHVQGGFCPHAGYKTCLPNPGFEGAGTCFPQVESLLVGLARASLLSPSSCFCFLNSLRPFLLDSLASPKKRFQSPGFYTDEGAPHRLTCR